MTREQALALVTALAARGIPAVEDRPDDEQERYCVIIRDSRDTVWYDTVAGWTFGPSFEHELFAHVEPVQVAEQIAAERLSCSQCQRLIGGSRS